MIYEEVAKNAEENKSLPADFTWPEKFGERTSMAYSKISNNSSHNSQVSLERQRIAIEMEKKKQTLEKQKLEIDNNMRLLQMEHDLENARLDAIEEVRSHRSQSNGTNEKTTISTQQRNKVPHCLYPEVMVVNDKSSSSDHEQFDLEVASKHKFNWNIETGLVLTITLTLPHSYVIYLPTGAYGHFASFLYLLA
ncbi:hypothetical protein JTB14_022247 [Gonioctena quinquepunctata]|nr:hypothetical protein JTB14_022247 [Gonioctena quinquepunctata]